MSPVVTEGATSRLLYLPRGQRWYSLAYRMPWGYKDYEVEAGWQTVEAPLDVVPLHVAGGSALPYQVQGVQEKDMNFQIVQHPFLAA